MKFITSCYCHKFQLINLISKQSAVNMSLQKVLT